MCVTIRPISSMWPTMASVGPSPVPFTRAIDDPITSTETSANPEAAARHAAAGAVSWPEGPVVVSRVRRTSGRAMRGTLAGSAPAAVRREQQDRGGDGQHADDAEVAPSHDPAEAPVDVVAHHIAVAGDEEDRQVSERQ